MFFFEEIKNKAEWNKFLYNFPTLDNKISAVTFIQSWNWGDFNELLGHKILRLGIYEDAKLVGVCLGVVIRAKRGNYLYIRNGPVLDWNNQLLVQETIRYLKLWSKKNNLWFIRMSPLVEKGSQGESNILMYKFPENPMNDVEALDTWIIDLSHDIDTLFSRIKKKNRYYIRKAEQEKPEGYGLTSVITRDPEHVKDFYAMYEDTYKRQNWQAYSYDYIKKEFESFVKDGLATLILMKYDEKFIAGGIFLSFASQSFYHLGASLSEYQNVPASYLMLWHAIKFFKNNEDSHFNLWGISPADKPNHPWAGLSRFKKKFPGMEQRWAAGRDIPITKLYWLTHLYDKFDKYRKGY